MLEQYLTSLVTLIGGPDYLVLASGLAIFLMITSKDLRPPWGGRLRGCSIVLAGFCIGNLILAIIFGVDLRFKMLETASAQMEVARAKYQKAGKDLVPQKSLAAGNSLESGPAKEGRGEGFPSGTWVEVAQWEGSDSKETKAFHISSRPWMISWFTQPLGSRPGILSVKLHKANGEFLKNVTFVTGISKDCILIQEPGNYSLSIRANQKYHIVAYRKR